MPSAFICPTSGSEIMPSGPTSNIPLKLASFQTLISRTSREPTTYGFADVDSGVGGRSTSQPDFRPFESTELSVDGWGSGGAPASGLISCGANGAGTGEAGKFGGGVPAGAGVCADGAGTVTGEIF